MKTDFKSYLKEKALFRCSIVPFVRWLKSRPKAIREIIFKSKYPTISRATFLRNLKTAINNNTGYAVGKIGYSEQHWMYYEIYLNKERDEKKIKEFQKTLNFHGLKQEGVFPANPDFYIEFTKFYIPHVQNIDCLGICYRPWELEIMRYFDLNNKLIFYQNQQAVGMNHKKKEKSYLPFFENKKILIICPFAEALKERATKEIFEGLWSKTPKKKLNWFNPKKIDAFEIPYGFDEETQKEYTTAINLFRFITSEIETRDFDIAMIGAGGLAIPIASFIKSIGKIGIDLGGHLQIIFGVLGERYRIRETWQKYYFNDCWVDMPKKYLPKQLDVCDRGAYW